MTRHASALPDDIDSLKAMLIAAAARENELQAQAGQLQTETEQLKAEIVRMAAYRGQNPGNRRAARQDESAAIVADLWQFWETELSRISGKSKLAEAIRYARSRREALERFLNDGRLDIDSNAVERAIRPQAITRKNALFAGSDGGGKTWATIATLLQTAKMNYVDPFAWLSLTLQRIAAGWPNRDLHLLLPFNYHDS